MFRIFLIAISEIGKYRSSLAATFSVHILGIKRLIMPRIMAFKRLQG